MLIVKTYLDKSEIHGIGLFADEDIEKGKVVGKITNLDFKVNKISIANRYMDWMIDTYVDKGEYIQTYMDNMRFMNHSEDPNCFDTENVCIAIKDIKKGQELTCDYKNL